MSAGAVDWGAYVDAVAPALGLPIAPAHRDGVVRYLALAASFHATLVEGPPLAPTDEAAPSFLPVGPGDLPR